MGQEREREIARYTAEKQRLKDQYNQKADLILSNEGVEKWVITILIGALDVILGLMLAPEPLLTKIIGALLALLGSIFAVWVVYKIIVGGSLDNLKAEQTDYNTKEKAEDDRHDAALKSIGDK
jgi:hypothetical protein